MIVPQGFIVSDLDAADAAAILDLNRTFERETAPLDAAGLTRLLDASRWRLGLRHPTTGLCGFLIACDHGSGHGGENFRWFRERCDRFLYVDRVILAPSVQGLGLGDRLYAPILAEPCPVACEVHLVPPNSRSLAFHKKLGFDRIGQARISTGAEVAYLMRPPGISG